MGKGDKKTKKGKLSIGSFGNSRKRAKAASVAPKAKPSSPKISDDTVKEKKKTVKKKEKAE
jgi:30S ribosomal protein S31